MNELFFLGKFQIDKLHVFLASQAKILHQCLKKSFSTTISRTKSTGDLGIENLRLFDATCDMKKFDQGV